MTRLADLAEKRGKDMGRTFSRVMAKLALLAVLSSAAAFTGARVQAHELQPTIADVTVESGQLTLA